LTLDALTLLPKATGTAPTLTGEDDEADAK